MPITRLFPILSTTDLPRLVRFYEEAFGASVAYRFDNEGVDVYVSLKLGEDAIGIGMDPDVRSGGAIAVWLYADDVDAVYRRAVEAGAETVTPPADMPWGERVSQVRDPDGNLLHVATGPEE